MIGTYVAVLAVGGASLVIGQAAVALCGRREWSWLAPAVGLALLCAVCWGTVRLPGEGVTSAAVVLVAVTASLVFLRGRMRGAREALAVGAPAALLALLAGSLPFIVEGRFGILGTGFNPDMSQHLLAAERLAGDGGGQLLAEGYPLGPHAVVAALHDGLGIGLAQGFGGLTVAVTVLAALTALSVFAELPRGRRTVGALLVALTYLIASYFAQGAFKETTQALFFLAFALGLREVSRPESAWNDIPLRFLPPALVAVGSVYAYSFPGLIWLGGTAAIWALWEVVGKRTSSSTAGPAVGALLSLLVFAVLAAPELGRMIDFGSFETFDPAGPGLGNLFGQISPFEALGIWPSGDFRLAPGDGAVPAIGFYLGAGFASLLFAYGLVRCRAAGERAILAAVGSAVAVYAAARLGGTAYTSAKALAMLAPPATLVILCPLLNRRWDWDGVLSPSRLAPLALTAYATAAAGCSLLALANAPVGPTSYSSALTELRPLLAPASTTVLAPPELLDEQHGRRYLAWELRGGRVCIEPVTDALPIAPPPRGVRFVLAAETAPQPPFTELRLRRRAGDYTLWERAGPLEGPSDCPLIEVRQARQAPRPLSGETARIAWNPSRRRPRTSPSSCPTARRWSCPRGRAAPTRRRRSAPDWPRRRWRSAPAASCATSPRRCATASGSRSSPTATPRPWS